MRPIHGVGLFLVKEVFLMYMDYEEKYNEYIEMLDRENSDSMELESGFDEEQQQERVSNESGSESDGIDVGIVDKLYNDIMVNMVNFLDKQADAENGNEQEIDSSLNLIAELAVQKQLMSSVPVAAYETVADITEPEPTTADVVDVDINNEVTANVLPEEDDDDCVILLDDSDTEDSRPMTPRDLTCSEQCAPADGGAVPSSNNADRVRVKKRSKVQNRCHFVMYSVQPGREFRFTICTRASLKKWVTSIASKYPTAKTVLHLSGVPKHFNIRRIFQKYFPSTRVNLNTKTVSVTGSFKYSESSIKEVIQKVYKKKYMK